MQNGEATKDIPAFGVAHQTFAAAVVGILAQIP